MNLLRSRVARAVLLDGLVAVLAGVVAVLGSRQAAPWTGGTRGLDAWGYGLMVAAAAALVTRRLWPLPTLVVTVGLSVAYLAAGYPVGPFFWCPRSRCTRLPSSGRSAAR
jgi:hypothetical protein